MDMVFTEQQERWRAEVDDFLRKEVTPALIADAEKQDYVTAPFSVEFSRKLAAKGWLALSWPKEYGGQGRDYLDTAILEEQMGYRWAPVEAHRTGCAFVANGIMEHGTPEQKKRVLPQIARQEVIFCEAYTEPEAGTDLATLKTKAIFDGKDYVVNGEKTFCSGFHFADCMHLAARTDPASSRHRGISMFIVDVKAAGVTYRPMKTINHGTMTHIFFDNVRVSPENLIGAKDRGWQQLMSVLAAERTGLHVAGANKRIVEWLAEYARATQRGGQPVISDPVIRHRLAELAVEIEAGRMLSWRVACLRSKGNQIGVEGNIQALFHREIEHRLAHFGMQVLGQYGQLHRDSRWAPLNGIIERLFLKSCAQVGGAGNTELQKNIVAVAALGFERTW
ncbi:MAG: acyl-CoA dehydrogenase family protein [Chloroflexi bacterium]|nr:acyl-CoA dehydrogenase family protein [Chloroflexota bacterium]